jgi:starvation-inducible outer membrane lipoprotein
MIKKLLIIFVAITLTSCATISDKMPKRQACTGEETNKTLAEALCKKQ